MADVEFVEWGAAIRDLYHGKANGEGTASSFRGFVGGKYRRLCDCRSEVNGTPAGQVIVEWLKSQGVERRPANFENKDLCHVPKIARPAVVREGVYLDIRAAYYSILSRVEWDINFLPSRKAGSRGRVSLAPLMELLPTKFSRNAVVGLALSTRRLHWVDGVASVKNARGGFYNPQLAWFCWAILGAAARIAHDIGGAAYWNVDGGIIPADRAAAVADRIRDVTGLESRVKLEGNFMVWGVGSFTCFGYDGKETGKPKRLGSSYVSLPDPLSSSIALRMLKKTT